MDRVEPCFLVEWYTPVFLDEELAQTAAKLDAANESVSACGTPIRVSALIAVPNDEVVFGIFVAGSAETVTQACVRAGFPCNGSAPPPISNYRTTTAV